MAVKNPLRLKVKLRKLTKPRKKMKVHYSSETDKYNTPKWLVERVVSVLGTIELDPCAASDPTHIPALRHYAEQDNGLAQPWCASTLYINPPYGKEVKQWMNKLVTEYKAGNVKQAIALVGARPDTEWWSYLHDFPVIFVHGRLKFNDQKGSAPFPSAIFYLGPYWWTFAERFKDVGQLYMPLELARREFE